MAESDTERQRVTVTHKGKEHTYWVRELGYFEFQEVQELLGDMPDKTDKDKSRRGMEMMKAITVACAENEVGEQALDNRSLKKLPREIAEPLTDAAMKAQGIDMEKIRSQADKEEAADEGKASA